MTIGSTIKIGFHCCATMSFSHEGCLLPKENVTNRQTGIRCSSLTLEHEEHLKTNLLQAATVLNQTYKHPDIRRPNDNTS
jgi:hypothetical protein